jgi:hypothetical protein
VEYKKAKDEEERLHVEHEMAERERLAGMSKAAREVHARIQREAEVRQKWFYLVLIGSRLYTIQKSLLVSFLVKIIFHRSLHRIIKLLKRIVFAVRNLLWSSNVLGIDIVDRHQ